MTKALYLDNAATSFPKPEAVYTAVDHYQRHLGAAFARGTRGQEQADSVVARCRRELSRLIDAKDDRCIAFTYNATDGLNLLLRGILRSNQRVVTTTLEHNSVLRPLHQLKEQRSLLVDFVPFDIATGELDLQQFSVLLHEHPTDWVVLNLVSNVTGIVQPLLQISDLVRNAGARLLVDASQAVGHVPVSVKDAGIHLLAAAGHKALVGPLGTGFVYVAPELHDELVSNRCGGTGTRSSEPEQPRTMPELLESGNLNMPGIAGLEAALSWRSTPDFMQRESAHRQRMCRLISGLIDIPGVDVPCSGTEAENTGVVSFDVPGTDPREVGMILDQSFGIQCRAGLHCAPRVHQTLGTAERGGTVRLSPGLFTTEDEIERALTAVRAVAEAM